MRLILVSLPLALLAACSGGDSANKAGNAAAPEAANASAPAAPANASASADPRRANEVNECIADVAPELPAGADATAFCGCAVERIDRGSGEREAMDACAAQMGIQPRR